MSKDALVRSCGHRPPEGKWRGRTGAASSPLRHHSNFLTWWLSLASLSFAVRLPWP